jgi:hypothetical protein
MPIRNGQFEAHQNVRQIIQADDEDVNQLYGEI